ncbi:hypothetical protein ACWDQO_20740 [Streptomyces sp. NPDC003703]|uniref:hypothetical protein n=1 Tax=Streptomyces sp. NPDC003283 TaxID=3364681 RepID=UPI0036899422
MARSLNTTSEQVTWIATASGFAPCAVMSADLVAAICATATAGMVPGLTWVIILRVAQVRTAAAFSPAAFSRTVHHIAPQRRPVALTASPAACSAPPSSYRSQPKSYLLGPDGAVFLLSTALTTLRLLPVRRALRSTPRPDTGGGLPHAFAAMPRLLRKTADRSPRTWPP